MAPTCFVGIRKDLFIFLLFINTWSFAADFFQILVDFAAYKICFFWVKLTAVVLRIEVFYWKAVVSALTKHMIKKL